MLMASIRPCRVCMYMVLVMSVLDCSLSGGTAMSPSELERRVERAQQTAAAGDPLNALAQLEDLVTTTNHPGIRLLTAKLCFEHAQWGRSRHHFEVLAQDNSPLATNAEVWYSLGVLADQHDHNAHKARDHYRKAVTLDPRHASALANLGTVIAGLSESVEAQLIEAMKYLD
eukprot:m.216888 g.216888  ORF g.216888 m.216888 type:complete len:172 (+) comp28652_c0_seq1:126-641(+)